MGKILNHIGKLKHRFIRGISNFRMASDVATFTKHHMYVTRPTLFSYIARRALPARSVTSRAKRFTQEIGWYGDVRASVIGLPLSQQWITISDREGHLVTAEGSSSQLIHLLDASQDQWDVFQQVLGRIFSLSAYQFETCSVLYRDGLPLDSAIEAAKRL